MPHPHGFTQFPHLISDAMHLMSWPEWICTDVLVRETFGWHREWAYLPQREFLRRTPIKSRATVIKALQAVEARGFWLIGPRFREE